MPSKIAGLFVDLDLNTAKFIDGLDKSRTKATAFGVAVGNIMSSVAASVASSFLRIAESVPKLAIETAKTAEAISRASQQIGIGTDQLQKFQYAGRQLEISNEELTRSFALFSKQVEASAQGPEKASSASARALQILGISIRDANGDIKPTAELIKETADRFATLQDGAFKTGLAMQLFGRSGSQIIPFLNLGSKGLDEMGIKAADLGVVLGGDVIRSAKEFDDHLKDLGEAFDGLKYKVGVAAIPALDSLIRKLNDAIDTSERFYAAFNKEIDIGIQTGEESNPFIRMAKDAAEWLKKHPFSFGTGTAESPLLTFQGINVPQPGGRQFPAGFQNAASLSKLPLGPPIPASILEAQAKALEEAAKKAEKEKKELESLTEAFKKSLLPADVLAHDIGLLNDKFSKSEIISVYGDDIEKAVSAQLDHGKAIPAVIASLDDERISLRLASIESAAFADLLKQMGSGATQAKIDITELNISIAKTKEELEKAGFRELSFIDFSAVSESNSRAIDKIKESTNKALEEQKQAAAASKEAFNDLSRAIDSTFEDAIVGGKGLGEVFKGLIDDIERMIIRLLVVGPIMKKLSDYFSSKSGSGGILGGILGALGGAIGGLSSGINALGGVGGAAYGPAEPLFIPHFASGGFVGAGQLSLVGESGPELFMPNTSGWIMPNSAMNAISGGGRPISITYAPQIDARGADVGSEQRIRRALQETHAQAVQDSLRIAQEIKLRTP